MLAPGERNTASERGTVDQARFDGEESFELVPGWRRFLPLVSFIPDRALYRKNHS